MKILFTTLLLLACLGVYSQELKTIKNKIDKQKKEVYTVLQTNPKVRHGTYSYYVNDELRITGSYKNGQKEGMWKEENEWGQLVWQGAYANDQKTGPWKYYRGYALTHQVYKEGEYVLGEKSGHWKLYEGWGKEHHLRAESNYVAGKRMGVWNFYVAGATAQQFDFDKMLLKSNAEHLGENQDPIQSGPYKDLNYRDNNAHYKSGEAELMPFLGSVIQYPQEAYEKGITGTVYVTFQVDKTGAVQGIKILRSVDEALDQEALRVVKLTAADWKPATFEGEKVNQTLTLPINFQIKS